MKPRGVAGLVILAAWFAGVGMMLRRELFRPHIDRLAEAALRVTPGAVFYAVMQGDRQVGFASSTLDTATTLIEQRDYLVADVMAGGQIRRATARTNVQLTRTLRMRAFETAVEREDAPLRVQGQISGDTTLSFVVNATPGVPTDTQRVRLDGPVLLPALVPLAVALDDRPKVGRRVVLPVFDATTRTPREVSYVVQAESVFVVNDSSVFDSTASLWRGVLPVSVRAWRVAPAAGAAGDTNWVDEQGRVVSGRQLGFELRRMPYEVAFENWRRESEGMSHTARSSGAASASRRRDILDATLIASNRRLGAPLQELRVRIGGVPLAGLDLDGGRQRLRGDTLTVRREASQVLAPRYFPVLGIQRGRVPELRQEPFLEVDHREITALAERLADRSRDPRVIAERINRWVHDSVRKDVTVGIPSALHVLHTRVGDANEHAQLFVAIARAAGVPARIASGLVYVDGRFHYHSWAEAVLRGWVAVDPTFGQFPADAAHLRIVTGGLGRQADLLRLIERLQIQVLATR